MKTTIRIAAALSFAAAGAAFAEGPIAFGEQQAAQSQLSRAEVVAQVLAAGAPLVTEADLQKLDVGVGTLSRAEVRNETLAAIRRGEVSASGAEIFGAFVASAPAQSVQMAGIAK